MPKTSKNSVARKTVKARGAIPTPRLAPERKNLAWHHRPASRIVGGVFLLLLLGFGIKAGLDFKKDRELTKTHARAVKLFENKYQRLQGGVNQAVAAIGKSPAEFAAGKLPAEEYRKQTEAWLVEFRKLDSGLRGRKVPPSLPELDEIRGIFVHSSVIYIDAAKSFQLAAGLTDPGSRDQAIKQGNNLVSHAQSLVQFAQRDLTKLKTELGLVEEQPPGAPTPAASPAEPPPVNLPSEEAPPPAPATDPAAGQVPPGMPGSGPGLPPSIPEQPPS